MFTKDNQKIKCGQLSCENIQRWILPELWYIYVFCPPSNLRIHI